MLDQNPGQQRKDEAAEAAGHAGETGRAANLVVGKQVGDGAKHVGGEKVVRQHGDADQQQSHDSSVSEGDEEAGDAEEAAAVHQDFAHPRHGHAPLQQPTGGPTAGYAARVAHDERNPGEDADLQHRHVADAVEIAGNPVPVKLDDRADEEAARHHSPTGGVREHGAQGIPGQGERNGLAGRSAAIAFLAIDEPP